MNDIMKKIKECFIEHQKIPYFLICEYINQYVKKYHIEDAFQKIIRRDGKGMGYNDVSRTFQVDFLAKSTSHRQLLNIISKDYDNTIDNLFLLYYIFHELNHVKQNSNQYYEKHKNSLYYGEYIKSDWLFYLMISTSKQKSYKKYHDYFLFEYMSIINGKRQIETLYEQFFKSVIPDHIMQFYQQATATQLLVSYQNPFTQKITSPIEIADVLYKRFVEEMEQIDKNKQCKEILNIYLLKKYFKETERVIEEYQNSCIFTRLKLGLPIPEELKQYLFEVSKGYQKTTNLFRDIRNLK